LSNFYRFFILTAQEVSSMSNSPTRKLTVGVLFGSRSVEHDVSIVTAQQVIKALNPAKYDVIPLYITRDGAWLTGNPLADLNTFKNENVSELVGVRETTLSSSTQLKGTITPPISGLLGKSVLRKIDVMFPCVHGTHGEDGTLQGLFELMDVPYVGAGVAASAVANDKIMTKAVLEHSGLVVNDYMGFTRYQWLTDRQRLLAQLEQRFRYPLFVKPATLGSSIGVARVADQAALVNAIDVALNFDRRVLVEAALVEATEINCAVMGNEIIRPSVLEQPVSYEQFLTYDEKYMRGGDGMKGSERIIPAPLGPDLTANIRQIAVDTFRAINGRGTARIDFLVKEGIVYVNEINTLPGSLSFYLWSEEGMTPPMVCDELIRLAMEAYTEKRRTTYNYKSGLIAQASSRGLKGIKK
jgi:D-alanine-D-alanine ligase